MYHKKIRFHDANLDFVLTSYHLTEVSFLTDYSVFHQRQRLLEPICRKDRFMSR